MEFDAFGPDFDKTPSVVEHFGFKMAVFGKLDGQSELLASLPSHDRYQGPGKAIISKPDGSDPHYFIYDNPLVFTLAAYPPDDKHPNTTVVVCGPGQIQQRVPRKP